MKHLVIIGVGGFAREVYWHAQDSHGYGIDWDIKGFLDGDMRLADQEYEKLNMPVLGSILDYNIQENDVFICAIGDGDLRKKFVDIIQRKHGKFINLISNQAIIHGNVEMGIGNIICPFCFLQDNAKIGDFVVFNTRSGAGHDAVVGSYSSFMSGACLCGYAKTGEGTYWGTYAVGLPHSSVGNHVQVGVGSVVFKKVRDGKKVFGNPAMPM